MSNAHRNMSAARVSLLHELKEDISTSGAKRCRADESSSLSNSIVTNGVSVNYLAEREPSSPSTKSSRSEELRTMCSSNSVVGTKGVHDICHSERETSTLPLRYRCQGSNSSGSDDTVTKGVRVNYDDELQMFGEEDLQLTSHPSLQQQIQMLTGGGSNGIGVNGVHALSSSVNGMHHHLSEDRQCSTDRSISATPSQSGDVDEQQQEQDLEDDGISSESPAHSGTPSGHPAEDSAHSGGGRVGRGPEEEDVRGQMEELKGNFQYMSHQMSRIMKALHVPPCMCDSCAKRHQLMNGTRPLEDPMLILTSLFPQATSSQLSALADMARAGSNSQQSSHNQQQQQQQQYQQQQYQQRMGQGYMVHPGGGKIQTMSADKKMVAEYARQHGAVAAAKRFGIPPPVSTYYQRKDSSNALMNASGANASPGPSSEGENDGSSQTSEAAPTGTGQAQQQQMMRDGAGQAQQSSQPGLPSLQTASSLSNTSQQHHPQHQQQQQLHSQAQAQSVPSSPLFPGNMMDMTAMLKMNAAHATGSPGFLRGRGRGRPKLIGDELDADLVDYMVSVKQADPHGHLTASQALGIAKQYILEKAPGLLEEHGGHVKLKLTWAMKLVSRIAERQKEMELGLPAGTLSNMGRHQLNNLPGGNFMADMMAQNIISQHMMMGMQQQNGGGAGQQQLVKEESGTGLGSNLDDGNQSQQNNHQQQQENENEPHVGATPEILNVKELNLRFLTDLFGSGGGNEISGLVEGQMDGEQMDDDSKERPHSMEINMSVDN